VGKNFLVSSDYNAFAAVGNAFRDSGFDARGETPCDLPQINLDCTEDGSKALNVDLDECLSNSRLFFFLPTFPGDYTIRLTNVSGFDPYIDILTSGYGLVVGSEMTITIPVPPVLGGITGFVGSNDGNPGSFDIEVVFPTKPDFVTVSAGLAAINADFGTSFTGVMNYVPCGTYWEEISGPAAIRVSWLTVNQWQFKAAPDGNFSIVAASLGGGVNFPTSPVDPTGHYDFLAGPGAYDVTIT